MAEGWRRCEKAIDEAKLKLTRDQRSRLFRGEFPKLAGEGICPYKPGDTYRASARVSIEILSVRRPKVGGWSLEYVVYDQRPDQDRYLAPLSGPSEKQRETKNQQGWTKNDELGYTGNPRAGGDRAVPAEYQNVLDMEAHKRFAEHRQRERGDEENRRNFRALTAALKETAVTMQRAGVDPTPLLADMQRVLEAHKRELGKAA